jgi:hypothetical protein
MILPDLAMIGLSTVHEDAMSPFDGEGWVVCSF